jgi:transcriptional regulator with GAF, ATPase, and Fis domain
MKPSKKPVSKTQTKDWELLGVSKHIKALRKRIEDAARQSWPVLIEGPTGTGKELIAKEIHKRSARSDKLFIALNCGAIQRNMFLSELFGHEKGAFTGAYQRKIGQVELANGGILFLDEIGELKEDHQVAILRFMQDGTYRRLAGNKEHKSDVRIITATNKDLSYEVGKGNFREDLYHRLNNYIKTKPLSFRPEDVVFLVNDFIQKDKIKLNKPEKENIIMEEIKTDPRVIFLLFSFPFPGNVRELITLFQRRYDLEYIINYLWERVTISSKINIYNNAKRTTITGKLDKIELERRRLNETDDQREKHLQKAANDYYESTLSDTISFMNDKDNDIVNIIKCYEIMILLWAKLAKQEIANLLCFSVKQISPVISIKYCRNFVDSQKDIWESMPMRLYPNFTYFYSGPDK